MATAILIGGKEARSLDQQLSDLGYVPEIYSPHFSLVTPALISACRAKGMKLIPWTVNEQDDMRRLKEMGVDGIITDYVNLLSDIE
jgi:glycerophosphoryl diester phosphodiesterase